MLPPCHERYVLNAKARFPWLCERCSVLSLNLRMVMALFLFDHGRAERTLVARRSDAVFDVSTGLTAGHIRPIFGP